ncbi:MAG: hypothetical protein M5U35_16930 [Roseovarius sp.]|nr:hypothetical protein [Roseovarius sp.]
MRWGLPLQGLWLALMLMAVLLSLLVSGVFHLAPMPPGEIGDLLRLSPAYHSPLVFAVINWGQALISIFVLHWIGHLFGGQGALADMLAVMIWLQFVSLVLAAGLFVAGLVLPVAAGVLTFLGPGLGALGHGGAGRRRQPLRQHVQGRRGLPGGGGRVHGGHDPVFRRPRRAGDERRLKCWM